MLMALKRTGQTELKEKLNSIPAMSITKSDLEKLQPEDYPLGGTYR